MGSNTEKNIQSWSKKWSKDQFRVTTFVIALFREINEWKHKRKRERERETDRNRETENREREIVCACIPIISSTSFLVIFVKFLSSLNFT